MKKINNSYYYFKVFKDVYGVLNEVAHRQFEGYTYQGTEKDLITLLSKNDLSSLEQSPLDLRDVTVGEAKYALEETFKESIKEETEDVSVEEIYKSDAATWWKDEDGYHLVVFNGNDKFEEVYDTYNEMLKNAKAMGVILEEGGKEAEKIWGVWKTGGSIGESTNKFVVTGLTKEEAKETAKRYNKGLSAGEKSYYKLHYSVKEDKSIKTDIKEEEQNKNIITRMRKLFEENEIEV